MKWQYPADQPALTIAVGRGPPAGYPPAKHGETSSWLTFTELKKIIQRLK